MPTEKLPELVSSALACRSDNANDLDGIEVCMMNKFATETVAKSHLALYI